MGKLQDKIMELEEDGSWKDDKIKIDEIVIIYFIISLKHIFYCLMFIFLGQFIKDTTKWNMSGPVCHPWACGFVENDVL